MCVCVCLRAYIEAVCVLFKGNRGDSNIMKKKANLLFFFVVVFIYSCVFSNTSEKKSF